MDWRKEAKKLNSVSGTMVVETVTKTLDVSERTAINYISELKKRGFVETERGKKGKRIYNISPIKKIKTGYLGLYETINKYSPIKLVEPYEHRIHDHKLTPEEAIIRAVATKNFRVILASLALFSKVKNWSMLYSFAKQYKVGRFVGALYDLSRKCLRVRRMDGRIRNKLRASQTETKYIIPNIKSRDFKDKEKEWDVFIPFNRGDLAKYKE